MTVFEVKMQYMSSLWQSLYYTMPTANNLEEEDLKTLSGKEKMLVTCISFSHNVYFPVSLKFYNLSYKQALVFTCLQYKSFENTAGKGDIDHNEQFLLFPLWS